MIKEKKKMSDIDPKAFYRTSFKPRKDSSKGTSRQKIWHARL